MSDTTEALKVSELSGALLDYWATRAAGDDPELWGNPGEPDCATCMIWIDSPPNPSGDCGDHHPHCPSQDWGDGGPIIEREHIRIWFSEGGTWMGERFTKRWFAATNGGLSEMGETPLEAAMRCYVVSKLGATVPGEIEWH